MSRKWHNITFSFDGSRDDRVQAASANPPTKQEQFESVICDKWDDEFLPHHYNNIDLTFGGLGYGNSKLIEYLEFISSECPFLEAAGVLYRSDGAMEGTAYFFDLDSGRVELVDTYNGVEGARGADAADTLYEEHSIAVDEAWTWD